MSFMEISVNICINIGGVLLLSIEYRMDSCHRTRDWIKVDHRPESRII